MPTSKCLVVDASVLCAAGPVVPPGSVPAEPDPTPLLCQDVLNVIQRTLDHLTESLAHGQAVELRNFGVFEVKLRKARVGRNPNRPEHDVPIPPRAVVKFKAGKEMKSQVMKLSQVPNSDGAAPASGSSAA